MTPRKSTLYYMLFRILAKFITYFLLLVLANLYLVEDYGKAFFVLSVFFLLNNFVFLGLPAAFVPFIVKKKNTKNIFLFLLFLTLISTLIGLIISIKYLWLIPLVISIPFYFFANISFSIFRAEHRHHLVQFFELGMIITPLILVFVFRNLGFNGIIWAYSAGFILSSILAMLYIRKELRKIVSGIKIKNIFSGVKPYLIQAIPIAFIGISFSIMGRLDSTILGFLSTYENVAKYNIALPIAELITIFPMTIGMFLLTRTAEIGNKKTSKLVLDKAVRLSFSLCLLFSILLSSSISLILKLFFPKYAGIEIYIMILLIGMVFNGIYILVYSYFVGNMESKRAFLPIIISVIVNILLDIILIPKFGLLGISIGTTAAQFTAFILLAKGYYRTLFFIPFIPLSFYLGYYGFLVLIVIIPLMFLLKLLEINDIKTLYNTAMDVIRRE
jgi:O-antigen/teichoic acid export membrane protein